jgi:NADPH-dependent ferric siderophore reductase
MSGHFAFRLAGAATPADGRRMLDEVCDHFVEHAEVRRVGDTATLTDELGSTVLRLVGDRIEIELASPSQAELDLSRNHLAEHMFYFAGAEPLDLIWRAPPPQGVIANLHEATVVAAYDVTRNMRRVVFRCADIEPFLHGDIHVRLLIPARGREPVWPGYRADGRVDWPEGEDAPVVRAYTIRAVDAARCELSIDFLQHPSSHGPTPGADFARDAKAGERVALLGPGSGGIPRAQSILLAGDESALPAIARIVEELPPGASARAIIEVEDAGEERYLPRIEGLDVTWLHRSGYAPDEGGRLGQAIGAAIENMSGDTFVFVACEKQDVRSVRTLLKRRGHARGNMYVAWYWERQA